MSASLEIEGKNFKNCGLTDLIAFLQRPMEKTVEKNTERNADRQDEKPIEINTERNIERNAEKNAEKNAERKENTAQDQAEDEIDIGNSEDLCALSLICAEAILDDTIPSAYQTRAVTKKARQKGRIQKTENAVVDIKCISKRRKSSKYPKRITKNTDFFTYI